MKKNIIISILVCILIVIIGIFATKGIPNKEENIYTTISDLKGKKIGTLMGIPLSEEQLRTIIPDAEFTYYNGAMDSTAALRAGQIDAALVGYAVAKTALRNIPELAAIETTENTQLGIAVSKEQPELFEKINSYLKELKENGELEKMKEYWYNPNSDYKMPEIELPTEGEPFVVAVCADKEPMSFLDGEGNVIGFDAELAIRIAKHINRPIEFIEVSFQGLVPAVESGKADVIISNLMISEERKKLVFMTESYFDAPYIILVKKGN